MYSPVTGLVDGIGESGNVRFLIRADDDHAVRAPRAGRVQRIATEEGTFEGERWTVPEPKTARITFTIADVTFQLEVGKPQYITNAIDVFVREGDTRARGARIAQIILGSRAEIFGPAGTWKVLVRAGDKVRAGETKIYERVPFRVIRWC